MAKVFSISMGVSDTLYFPLDEVLYFEADGNYTILYVRHGDPILITSQLGVLAQDIAMQLGPDGYRLVRTGRGVIINVEYVREIDVAKQVLILDDYAGCRHILGPSQAALQALRETMLRLIKNNLI